MKIVINKCYGGFSLSYDAEVMYCELVGKEVDGWGCREVQRNDPKLIEVVEALGEQANSRLSDLKIVEIPDDVEWHIEQYDGMEWVAENHRTWD